jgi:hypothetical protein
MTPNGGVKVIYIYHNIVIATWIKARPCTVIVFYQERSGGEAPVLDWLRDLRRRNATAYQKCVAGLEHLARLGHGEGY